MSMTRQLIRYVLLVLASVFVSIMLWLVITVILNQINVLESPSALEKKLNELIPYLEQTEMITEDMIPTSVTFAVFEKERVYGNFSDQQVKQVKPHLKESRILGLQYVYLIIPRTDDTLVLHYMVRPHFTVESLNRIIPNYDLFILAMIILTFLLLVTWLTKRFVKHWRNELAIIDKMVEEIAKQNLSFESKPLHIKELANVQNSILSMRNALKTSLEKQWKLEEAKKEQVNALAHDIKIPLTLIRGNAELLSIMPLPDQAKTYVNYIEEATNRVNSYIETLIALQKADDTLNLTTRRVNMQNFGDAIYESSYAYALPKDITITYEANGEAVFDADLVERALLNMLSNAVDFTSKEGVIHFTIIVRDEAVHFVVEDSGKGFSEEDLEHAADLFYMADKSRSATGHYGMGLAFVQKVANLHGGTFEISNNSRHGGAKVALILPLEVE